MGSLVGLENSALAQWVQLSPFGYPFVISAHAVGMAIMVGVALTLDLRLLGFFPGLPLAALHRFLGLAWAGFGINFLSGVALFAAQATSFAMDGTFQLKIGLVLLGSITAALLQTALGRDSSAWATTVPVNIRIVALASILFWVGAIVTGRLTAYL
jgi:hypothetical protein